MSAPEGGARTPAAARRAFLAGGSAEPFESAERLHAPASPYILQAGSLIPAALITGIRSDLPGQVTAQVTQNRSEEHTSELQSLMRISYAVLCLKNKQNTTLER